METVSYNFTDKQMADGLELAESIARNEDNPDVINMVRAFAVANHRAVKYAEMLENLQGQAMLNGGNAMHITRENQSGMWKAFEAKIEATITKKQEYKAQTWLDRWNRNFDRWVRFLVE